VTSLETNFTEDLKKFDVPTLILLGEDDQIVPVQISTMKSAGIIKDPKDIIYPAAPHAIAATHRGGNQLGAPEARRELEAWK